ncbi:MAG: helix-turn-helix transcriptional regulator [Zoogloea sp.]|jgi:transcriptional regulator with XRE-family HTH domain|uniref:XRE family transcriptional regulator n=1 Tax=Zoogloea oleivorans TaxID=1552750 RepID=A0A6C2CBN4_9RHOO|nr:MAG: helix-turn-helix transcriptional regulator [Zoogloea sp.]TYC51404.1 XRE family transcriptional regulator [Zoogloea oleivorans]
MLVAKSFDDLRAELANEIKQTRRRLGLSQEALALQAEVDRTYVSQLERGIANPSILILHRISTVLGTDLSISLRGTSDV